MNTDLTPAGDSARTRILSFVKTYWQAERVSPSNREIQLALGISSTSVVDYHLRIMEREGMIQARPKGRTRSIVPTGMTISFQ